MLAAALALALAAPPAPGTLVIVGGGRDPQGAIAELVRAAGDRSLIVLPQSREDPAATADRLRALFEGAGGKRVEVVASLAESDAAAAIRRAAAVYLPGGDQNRFVARFGPRGEVAAALRALLARGGTIGGSSAGASLMGRWMPTGAAAVDTAIRPNPKGLTDGLDLLPNTIVDQHFLVRGRLPRLVAAVLETPNSVGIGIDERAYVVLRNGKVQAFDGQSVVVWADRRRSGAEARADLGAGDTLGGSLRMEILRPGDAMPWPPRG